MNISSFHGKLTVSLILNESPGMVYTSSGRPVCQPPPSSAVCGFVSVSCLLLGQFTGDYSWVDRIWSITPPLYVNLLLFHKSILAGSLQLPLNSRLSLMAFVTTVWGVRLTFNFWRRGGYSGGEDYRWEELRKMMSPFAFSIFNITFISTYQNILLLLISMPAYTAWCRSSVDQLNALDYVAASLVLVFITLETLTDNQQVRSLDNLERFQENTEKYLTSFSS
jgi:steroid 5-alpha reductase family enzyme